MKVIFRDIAGKKVTIEIPKDKELKDFKDDIFTHFKVDPKKKEIKKIIHNNKELQDQDTIESINYKDGDIISVMFTKISDAKPKPKAEPSQEKKEEKSESTSQVAQNPQTPQQPISLQAAATQSTNSQNSLRPPLQPTDTGLPTQGQRHTIVNSQPYPPARPTEEILGLENCFKIHDTIIRNGPGVILRALQSINPDLYQQVQANPGPFLRSFGIQQAPEYENRMVQDINQTLSNYTLQERQAVQRLINMGYDPVTVIQVFEAVGRSEETAAAVLRNL